jgi:hypothetical protein
MQTKKVLMKSMKGGVKETFYPSSHIILEAPFCFFKHTKGAYKPIQTKCIRTVSHT